MQTTRKVSELGARASELALILGVVIAGTPLGSATAVRAQSAAGYVNVKDFGALGNGVADDTAAIAAALNAIDGADEPAVLFLPAGVYNTRGDFDVTLLNGLGVIGAGTGATTLQITHPSNDLFFWTFNTSGQTYRDFSVRSSVTRTGGWVLHGRTDPGSAFGALTDTRIRDLNITGQANGIWLSKYSFVWIDRVLINGFSADDGVGIKVGQTGAALPQGANLYIQATEISGTPAGHKPAYGYWIEDAGGVFMADARAVLSRTSGLKIVTNGSVTSNLHFSQSVFDVTALGSSAHLTGPGVLTQVAFTGCEFMNAGQLQGASSPPAVLIDTGTIALTQFTGGRFFNARGDGIRLRPATQPANTNVTLVGVQIAQNGGNGIDVEGSVNALGPVISGVDEVNSGGVGLRTGASSNRIVVVGSRFVRGQSFGIAPQVAAHNGQ